MDAQVIDSSISLFSATVDEFRSFMAAFRYNKEDETWDWRIDTIAGSARFTSAMLVGDICD